MMNDGSVDDGEDELFTRVMQFGAFSPVFTNWGNNGSDDDLWLLPSQVGAELDGLVALSQLQPHSL